MQNPLINITAENGAITSTTTLQHNYYDLSNRLVAVTDANGNTTKRYLLAGSGYGGSDASVVKEFHPDTGIKTSGYDVFGDLRKATDELGNVTLMDYDAMDRLTTVTHPTRAAGSAGNLSGSAQTLIDYYYYDGLGQRITRWNNVYTSSTKDRTDYDAQGRVVQTVDMAGHVTSESYTWSSSISTAIFGGGYLGTFGGWAEATTSAAGLTSTTTVDYFNRTIAKTDFGGNGTSDSYNLAGKLASETLNATEHLEYRYYNTGDLKTVDDITVVSTTVTTDDPTSYYGAPIVTDYSHYNVTYPYAYTYTAGYDSWGNLVYQYDPGVADVYYDIAQHSNGTTTNVHYSTLTTTTTDRNTSFAYDANENRTYEGSKIDVRTDVGVTTTTYSVNGLTYYYYNHHTGSGYATNSHYYSYEVADPQTYYVYYTTYWVEDGYYYYDSCYGGDVFVDYGYGHNVYTEVDVPNALTYHTEYGTYYTTDIYYFDTSTYTPTTSSPTYYYNVGYAASTYNAATLWLENETVTYDGMNRVTQIHDDGYALAAPSTINMEYDANGNVRRRDSLFRALDASGNVAGTNSEQDNWYLYDSMNRFVTTKGVFSGTVTPTRTTGTITAGADGTVLTYDLAGNRHTATTNMNDGTTRQEIYAYTADGFLAGANISMNSGTPQALAAYGLDVMGRTTSYKEYDATGTLTYTRTATYDQISQVTHDDTTTVRSDGTYYSSTDYSYVAQSGTASGVATGAYLGGVLVHSHTTNSSTVHSTEPSTDVTNTYVMGDGPLIKTSTYVSDSTEVVHHAGYWETWTNSYSATWHDPWDETIGSATAWVSTYYYDAQGHLSQVSINDGQPRTVSYVTNLMGEVMKRDVAYPAGGAAPHELHYYLSGAAIGDVTNNGTSNTDYVTSIAARVAVSQGYGPFRNGASDPTSYADFDQSYDPINGYDSSASASNYVIKPGDTLQSIARSLWGDANLWYLIAQANGLSANSTLPVGMNIVIPNNQVHNFHNSSSTFKVYDPNLGIGDVSPTAPEIPPPPPPPPPPPAPAGHGHHGCGIIGTILLAVVAIAVVAVTAGAAVAALAPAEAGITGIGSGLTAIAAGTTQLSVGALIGIGAAAGAAGSIVSQGVGLATGIQSKFDWGAVAMSAIAGGVGGGLSATGAFSSLGEIGGAAARGVAGSVLTQGIGVATGLQSHFDWAGVAAAGVGAAVGAYAGQELQGKFNLGSSNLNVGATRLVSGLAGDIANAATRTLINGSDFGDNIIAALPDTIAQTIGGYLSDRVAEDDYAQNYRAAHPDASDEWVEAAAAVAVTHDYGSAQAAANSPTAGPIPHYNYANRPDASTIAAEIAARGIGFQFKDGALSIYENSHGYPIMSSETGAVDLSNPVAFNMDAFNKAVDYVALDPAGAAVVQKFFDTGIPVIQTNNFRTTSSDYSDGFVRGPVIDQVGDTVKSLEGPNSFSAVFWNPNAGVVTTDTATQAITGVLSPAMALLHEMDHAVGYSISPLGNWSLARTPAPPAIKATYGTMEERRVESGVASGEVANYPYLNQIGSVLSYPPGIGLENEVATTLGEPIRTNHYGPSPPKPALIPVTDVTMHRVGASGPLIPYMPKPGP